MGPKETREKNTNHLREPFFIIIFFGHLFYLFIFYFFIYLFFVETILIVRYYWDGFILIILFLFFYFYFYFWSPHPGQRKKKQVVQQLYYKAEVLVWSLKETRRLTETKNCITNDRTQKRNKRVSKG